MVEEVVFLDARGELGQLFHPIQAVNSPTKSHSASMQKESYLATDRKYQECQC